MSSLTLCVALNAQEAAAPSATGDDGSDDETVVLSPFIVNSAEDAGSYQATSTLAGTRVRTELKDVASAISVVTEQFLHDTGTHNAQDLLVYTPNTEVGGLRGNYSGQGGNLNYSEALGNPSANTRVRGLDTADTTRDYFLTDIPFDSFNVGRVDLQRGPNSILFGVGSPAGIINTSVNGASFKTDYNYENVTSSFGSQRNSIDLNQVVIPEQLSLRFAAVNDQQRFQQKPAFNNATRFYGALRFDPKLFDARGGHTSLRANYENGSVKSNNPRTIPPADAITQWFQTGTDEYGNPALNKKTINEFNPGTGSGSDYRNSIAYSNAMARIYWPTPVAFFNGSDPSSPGTPPAVNSSLPTQWIIGEIGTGWAIDANGNLSGVTQTGHVIPNQPGGNYNIGIGGLGSYQPVALNTFSGYAASNLPGGSYYADKVLTDPSIFDFYHKLLDGDNKREWQNWNAFNIALSQTFFDDRLGIEFAYDQQSYEQGQTQAMSSGNYYISVDVNETLSDGSPNPNLGRPYVGGAYDFGNQSQKTDRDSTRLTAFGELRAKDWIGNARLAKILGRHRFTGLAALDHKKQTSIGWSQYAATPQWSEDNNFDQSVSIRDFRLFNWVDYIGPNLSGASSAANAHLSNIQSVITPGANSSVRWFDSHWNHPLNPNDPAYVDPAAPYSYLDLDTGDPVASTQSNNPGNYVGWRQLPVTWMNADDPQDFPSLVTAGSRTRFRDVSKALIWQGYFFDGDLVATYGWRKDSIVNYNTSAPIDSSTSLAALLYSDDPNSRRTTDGQTRTWGVVYHLPKFVMKHLPGDSSLSVFFNKSHNFKADAPRTNFAGQQIPNPDGETKEYGFVIGALADKITLKATHYETTVHYATLNSDSLAGLGGFGYLLDLIPAWGWGYAGLVQAGLDGKFGNTSLNGPGDTAGNTQWNYAARDAYEINSNADLSVLGTPAGAANAPVATYGYGGTGQVTMKDIVNAWLNMPIPDNFFDFYGITGNRPDPAKARETGKIYLGFAQPFTDSGGLPGVGGQQPSGAPNTVSTVDNISKGWEYELSAQPTKNWNVTVNYSKTEATKNNIDPITTQFMADNLAFYQGPGGQLRLWGASQTAGYGANTNPGGPLPAYDFTPGQANGSTVGPQWIAGVYNPYLVTATAQGQSAPEVSPWRLNGITTYTFDHGSLNGLFIGGAVRLEAGRILGYRYDATSGILDVNQVLRGPNENNYDLWLGYTSKFSLSRKIKWRIQLNLRNVGKQAELVPARYQPDGTLALARIKDGMTWQLTNSFDF